MNTLAVEQKIGFVDVQITADELVVQMNDGRTIRVPLAWYPRLLHGTDAERQNFEIWNGGYAIEWPDLDEHIGAKGLAAGNRSGESAKSLARWLESRRK